MKKAVIFVLSTAMLAVVSCKKNNPTSEESSSDTSMNSSSSSATGTSSSSSSNSSSSSSTLNQTQAMALFSSALQKDYKNMTVQSKQQYENSMDEYETITENDTEYMKDGYVLVFSNDLESQGNDRKDCYTLYYVDSNNNKSYQYFPKDYKSTLGGTVSSDWDGGYLEKGYQNNDLSIWHAYAYVPRILSYVTADNVIYKDGYYYVDETKTSLMETLNKEAFGYAIYNDITTVAFHIGQNGYFDQIVGIENGTLDSATSYASITMSDFGTTNFPSEYTREKDFSQDNVKGYWQMMGYEKDYEDAYYTGATVAIKQPEGEEEKIPFDESSQTATINVDDTINFTCTLSPEQFEPYQIHGEANVEWHYDKDVLETSEYGTSETRATFHAIKATETETEIYVTFDGQNGKVESNKIKVKVNALKEQDKTDAIYDFTFTGLEKTGEGKEEHYKVKATNNVTTSQSLFDITAGLNVDLNDGKNSDIRDLVSGKQYLTLKPSGQEAMNHDMQTEVDFDFKEQQVSKISFNYGIFYENHLTNLSYLNKVDIQTRNGTEGEWTSHDVTEEVKKNISANFLKNLEVEFEPADQVKIVMSSSMIGKTLDICVDSVCFMANDQCHDYVPEGEKAVESINITPSENQTLYVGGTLNLSAEVLPQDAKDKVLTWHVEEGKDTILSVDGGLVTAKAPGSAKVWATSSNNVKSNEVTITVENMPTFDQGIVNKKFDGDYASVEITGDSQAKVTYSEHSISVSINKYSKDASGETFVMKNDQGEGCTLAFNSNRSSVTVTNFTYKSDNNLQTASGTYYASIVKEVSGFSLKVGDLGTLNASTTSGSYDSVYANDYIFLTVTPTPEDGKVSSVTAAADNSYLTVEDTAQENMKKVTFKEAGTTKVTVTVKDEYNHTFTKEVTFTITAKVYPTEEKFEIQKNKEDADIKVGNQVQFSLLWKDDGTINQSKDVTWSIDEDSTRSQRASINSRTGLLEAKAEGQVTVTATVQGQNGPISKSVEITIHPKDEAQVVPDTVVGVWSGADDNSTDFTFTVNADGTATLENENGSLSFTYSELKNGNEYIFVATDQENLSVGLWLSNNSLYFYDTEQTYWYGENDLYFTVYGEYVEVSKN